MQHHARLLLARVSVPEALTYYGDTRSYEVVTMSYPTLGIDEARHLIYEAQLRPLTGTHRLLVVVTSVLTTEAQHALLKILEEPPVTTLFYFIAPPEVTLLATLNSRFSRLEEVRERVIDSVFVEFLAASPAERLEEITARMTKKDQVWVEALRRGLLSYVAKKGSTSLSASVGYVLSRLTTRGAANKMLLEELALSLPVLRLP